MGLINLSQENGEMLSSPSPQIAGILIPPPPWPCHAAHGIFVLQPEINPMPFVVKAQSLNDWTAREVLPAF